MFIPNKFHIYMSYKVKSTLCTLPHNLLRLSRRTGKNSPATHVYLVLFIDF